MLILGNFIYILFHEGNAFMHNLFSNFFKHKKVLFWFTLILLVILLSFFIFFMKHKVKSVNKTESIASASSQTSNSSSLSSTSSGNLEGTVYDTSKFKTINQGKSIPVTNCTDTGDIVSISWINSALTMDGFNVSFIPELDDYNAVTVKINLYNPTLRIKLDKFIKSPTPSESAVTPNGPCMTLMYNFETNSVFEVEYFDFNQHKLEDIPEERLLEISQQLKGMVDECLKAYEVEEEINKIDVVKEKSTSTTEEERVAKLVTSIMNIEPPLSLQLTEPQTILGRPCYVFEVVEDTEEKRTLIQTIAVSKEDDTFYSYDVINDTWEGISAIGCASSCYPDTHYFTLDSSQLEKVNAIVKRAKPQTIKKPNPAGGWCVSIQIPNSNITYSFHGDTITRGENGTFADFDFANKNDSKFIWNLFDAPDSPSFELTATLYSNNDYKQYLDEITYYIKWNDEPIPIYKQDYREALKRRYQNSEYTMPEVFDKSIISIDFPYDPPMNLKIYRDVNGKKELVTSSSNQFMLEKQDNEIEYYTIECKWKNGNNITCAFAVRYI